MCFMLFLAIPNGEVKKSIAELVVKEMMNALVTGLLKCGPDKAKFPPLFEERGIKYVCKILRNSCIFNG